MKRLERKDRKTKKTERKTKEYVPKDRQTDRQTNTERRLNKQTQTYFSTGILSIQKGCFCFAREHQTREVSKKETGINSNISSLIVVRFLLSL